MKNYILLLLIGLISACSLSKNNNNNNNQELVVDIDINNLHSLTDLFSKIEVIPLETGQNSLVHNIDKIIEHKSIFYILDRRQKMVFIFKNTGEFITKINTIGRAPEEYILLEDIIINKFSNTLECLDPMGKILIYNLNGEFISTIYLPHSTSAYHNFSILNKDSILLYTAPRKEMDFIFRVFSRQQDQIVCEFFKERKIINWECCSPIQTYNDTTYFSQALSNSVYKIVQDTFSIAYMWNLDKYHYDISKIVLPDLSDPMQQKKVYKEILYSSKMPYTYWFNGQNNKFIYCSLFLSDKIINFFFDKKEKKIINLSTQKENIGIYPFYMDDLSIIGIANEDWMPIKSLYNSQNIKIINQEKIEHITNNSNPVIIKYLFK